MAERDRSVGICGADVHQAAGHAEKEVRRKNFFRSVGNGEVRFQRPSRVIGGCCRDSLAARCSLLV